MEFNNIFEVDESINVEEIMKQIRENISANNPDEYNLPEFNLFTAIPEKSNSNFDYHKLRENIWACNVTCHPSPEYQITSHRKIIGPLLVFGKKIVRKFLRWYIDPPWTQQSAFNANVVNSLSEVERAINDISEKIIDLGNLNHLDNLNKQVESLTDMLSTLTKKMEVFEERSKSQESAIHRQIEGVHSAINNHEHYIKNWTDEQIFLSEKIRRIERALKDETRLGIQNLYQNNNNNLQETSEHLDFDYYMFELLYRGSTEMIKQRQQVYLKYFIDKTNVLDIGCGRGEFLEILKENGVSAKGIDINEDMIRYCSNKRLDVELANIFDYIPKLPNESIDGIFISQVVEHLSPADMIKLLQTCYDKLSYGGIIAVETINPTTLVVFAESFYMDLSHIKPVHPLTLDFVLKSKGFRNLEKLYLSPVADEDKLIYIDDDANSPLNRNINKINSIIFGARDYAIIGLKN